VRRVLSLAIDQWHGAPALAKIADVKTVGGIIFPGSPLAATSSRRRSWYVQTALDSCLLKACIGWKPPERSVK
jgi:hypothetical protein